MSSVVSLTPEVRQYMLSWRSRVCIYCGNDRCLKRCKRCGVFVCSHECHTRSWVSTRVHRSCCERFHRIIVRHHRKADPFVGSPKRGKGDKEDAEKDESRKDEPPSARPKKDDVFDYDFEWWGDEKVLEDMSRIPQLNQPPDPVPAPGIQPSGPPSTSVSSTAPPAAPTAASPAATPAIPVFNVSGCDHVLFYKNVQRIPNAPPSSVSILLMEWANSGDLTVPSLFRLRTECLRNPVAPYSYEDARSWLAAQEQRQPIWLKLRKALAPASEAANFVGQGYVDHVPAGRIKVSLFTN